MTPSGRKRSGKGRGAAVAGVDGGGTNIEVGLVYVDHRVLARAKAGTPTEGPDAVDTIAALTIGAATTPSLLTPHPKLRFVAAALGDDSGVVGAAASPAPSSERGGTDE